MFYVVKLSTRFPMWLNCQLVSFSAPSASLREIFPTDLRRFFFDFFYVFYVVKLSTRFPLCALCVSARKIPRFTQLCAPPRKPLRPTARNMHLCTLRVKDLSSIFYSDNHYLIFFSGQCNHQIDNCKRFSSI
jgi:hypothetical protein